MTHSPPDDRTQVTVSDGQAWIGSEPERTAGSLELERAREAAVGEELRLAFAPIHKRAFGVAVGAAAALVVFGFTLFHLLIDPEGAPNLPLLAHYFYGYSVSWAGLAVGTFWGFIVGFVGGWFVAFCRNLVIAVSVFVTRTRVELASTRAFLDHI